MVARTVTGRRQALQYTPYAMEFPDSGTVANDSVSIATTYNFRDGDCYLFMRLYFRELKDSSQRTYFLAQTGVRGVFGIAGSTNNNKFGIDNGTGLTVFNTVAEIGKWYSLVLSFNRTTNNWTLYVNGVADANVITVVPSNGAVAHIIGAHFTTASWAHNGRMCGYHLLKRQCTAQEAIDWWETGTLPSTGTYEYKLFMNEGTGNPVDSGPNAYVCTKGSAVTWSSTMVPFKARTAITIERPVLTGQTKSIFNFIGSGNGATYTNSATVADMFLTGATVAFWYYAGPDLNVDQGIICTNTVTKGWTLRHFSGRSPRLVYVFSDTNAQFRLTGNFTAKAWNFCCFSYNAGATTNVPASYFGTLGGTLSIPAVSVATTPVGTAVSDVGVIYTVMDQVSTTNREVAGYMTDIMYFNKILTSAEVSNIFYYNQLPSGSSCIARWRSGSGTSFTDEIGGLNMTVNAPAALSDFVVSKGRTGL